MNVVTQQDNLEKVQRGDVNTEVFRTTVLINSRTYETAPKWQRSLGADQILHFFLVAMYLAHLLRRIKRELGRFRERKVVVKKDARGSTLAEADDGCKICTNVSLVCMRAAL